VNFEDEDYRRLYIRKTVTHRRLGWEGRAVMHEMLYEFDRAGRFELSGAEPEEAVELVTGLPREVVQAGLSRLLKTTQTWVVEDGRLVWPTFAHAQNCRRSDRLRQQQSRQNRDSNESAPGDPVTVRHSPSQPVTLSLAQPNLTKPNGCSSSSPSEPDPPPTPVTRVFDAWRHKLGHHRAKLDGKRRRLITARLQERPVEELLRAIDGVLKSDWHMGRDPKTAGQRYDDIEIIFRDAAHVEKFIELASGGSPIRPTNEHRRYAAEHKIDLDEIVARLSVDDRVRDMSTIKQSELLTHLLRREAERRGAA
jgi:hypothetical protein